MRNVMAKCIFLALLMLLATSAPVAGYYINMEDVDKPRLDSTYDNDYGWFTNDKDKGINSNWSETCWQAVAASMLNYVGFGSTGSIYDSIYAAVPGHNVGKTASEQVFWINDYIERTSPDSEYVAYLNESPDVTWAESMIHNSPLKLGVTIDGLFKYEEAPDVPYSGAHAIAYSGSDGGMSRIADPDADWRGTGWSMAPTEDWSWFDDDVSGSSWTLDRTWNNDSYVTFTVNNAIYLVPEPATVCLLALGGLALRRKRRAC